MMNVMSPRHLQALPCHDAHTMIFFFLYAIKLAGWLKHFNISPSEVNVSAERGWQFLKSWHRVLLTRQYCEWSRKVTKDLICICIMAE